ncbi:MAG TPA: MFS transporter [Actinomycetota bacterium]
MKPGLRSRAPLIALLSSSGVSMAGNVMAGIAVPWFVLQTTGSAARAGLAAAMSYGPTVVASLFGGVLVDRFGFKRTSVVADLASGATMAAIPLMHATVGLEFWQLMALVFTGSLLDAPGVIAREALVPQMAQSAGMPLERATASIQVIERTSRLVGAPLAGLVIAVAGATTALWIDAATFAVSGLAVALGVPDARVARGPRGRYWSEMTDGLRFLFRDRVVKWIAITVMVSNFLDTPLFSVALPVYAKRVLGSPVALGAMLGASGGGAVLGALIFGWLGPRLPRRAVFAGGFFAHGVLLWVLITLPPLPVAVAALALSGIAVGPLNPVIGAVQFERIPEHMRGRVFGAALALSWVSIPVGTILAGWLIEVAGLRVVFVAVAGAYAVWTLGIVVNPVFRELDASRRIPPEQPTPL